MIKLIVLNKQTNKIECNKLMRSKEYAELYAKEHFFEDHFYCNYIEDQEDIDIKRAKVADKRKAEYPTIEEIVVAILDNLDGDPSGLNKIRNKRQEVKAKYEMPKYEGNF